MRIKTGFNKTGSWKWHVMVFFWTNLVWRVFWYPFCVPYINFLIFRIFISAVGDEQHRSALIPLYHMSIISKHTKYQKIGGGKMWNFFLFENKWLFGDKIPVFSWPVPDTHSKLQNSDSRSKVTYTLQNSSSYY